MRSLVLVFVFLSGFWRSGQSEILSVCQLVSEPERFSGKWVTVIGTVDWNRHIGTAIRAADEADCPAVPVFTPPNSIDTSHPPRFSLVKDQNYRDMSKALPYTDIPKPGVPPEPFQMLAVLQGRYDSIYRFAKGNRKRFTPWHLGRMIVLPQGLVLHRVIALEIVPLEKWQREGLAIVDSMMKTQVDPTVRSQDGWTPLHYAVLENKVAAIAELVKAGDDPNNRAKDGRTPLHAAVLESDNPAIITALVGAGADPNESSAIGKRSLLGSLVPNRTPLHLAATFNDNPTIITTLIEVGADLLARTEKGWTALHFAAAHNRNPSISVVLVEAGNDPNAAAELGMTPLHLAAALNQNGSVISALVEVGADLRTRSADGFTPLDLAALENGNAAVVSALIDAGAAPTARSEIGFSAVDLAVANNNPAVVTAFLRAGSKVRTKFEPSDDFNEVMLGLRSASDFNTVGLLPHLCIAAALNENPTVISTLVEAGADPSVQSNNGFTPLHFAAASNNNPAVISTLVEAGADPSVRSKNGFTPLHFAAADTGNPTVITTLVEAGADPSVRSKNGFTPLHSAVMGSNSSSVPIIGALRDVGADPRIRDDSGKLPWDYVEEDSSTFRMPEDSDIYRWLKEASLSEVVK